MTDTIPHIDPYIDPPSSMTSGRFPLPLSRATKAIANHGKEKINENHPDMHHFTIYIKISQECHCDEGKCGWAIRHVESRMENRG